MLFTDTPRLKRPFPAFVASAILHCILIFVVTVLTADAPPRPTSLTTTKYSVRFVQLQIPQPYVRRVPRGSSQPGATGTQESAGLQSFQRPSAEATVAASAGSEPSLAGEPTIPRTHRRFELPPTPHVNPVKQTLVQLDLPPDIVMKQEIPLPTALLWNQTEPPPPMRKPFVAPAVKQVARAAERLPVAPLLERPNQEVKVGDLNVAATLVNEIPRLVHPAAVASPVSSAGVEPAKQIPQVAVADSSQSSPANLIALPENPLRSSTMLVLPPVNQIAPSGGNGGSSAAREAGTHDSGQGNGAQGKGPGASGESATGIADKGTGSGIPGSLAAGSGGAALGGSNGTSGGGAGVGPAGGAGRGNSNEGAGSSSGSGAAGSGGTPGLDTAGMTRLTLPKEGKFSVVVLGSGGAEPYPESAGALSGKVVYTVYLKMGLRKSWILQYCLPKASEQKIVTKGSATPLDAPWPFLMMRPDEWSASDPDYIMIHGIITSEGHFDELVMVFPDQLGKKDLLMRSLSLWAFRPAARDGVPIKVEVLLIIPRESD